MVLLKLCITVGIISCLEYCSKAEEQPELRFIDGKALLESLEPRSKASIPPLQKRQEGKSHTIHIENIYNPRQTPNNANAPQFIPVYPYYAYPSIPQYYEFPETSDNAKPNEIPKESSKPNKPASQTLKPQVIFGQTNGEQSSEHLTYPYPIVNQQSFLNSLLASTGGSSPYFLIVNNPQALGVNVVKPSSSSALSFREENEDESSEEEEIQEKPQKNSPNVIPTNSIKETSTNKKNSVEDLGLDVAKYLLGHPLYSANDMENISSNSNKVMGEGKSLNVKQNAADTQAADDYIPEADELTTKDVKLPLEFLLSLQNPPKKVDDRVALVYLRHTKRGRKLQVV